MTRKKFVLNIKTYSVVAEAVDRGILIGYRRAHKHTDTPSEDQVAQAISNAVMGELSDVVNFGE